MKIKNNRPDFNEQSHQPTKHIVSNKENIIATDCKRDKKVITRSKSTFGQDITKKMNEPVNHRHQFINKHHKDLIKLPSFLIKATAFNSEIAPYQESIIEYIIQTHDENEFPLAFRKKLKNKKNQRKYILEKMYKIFKAYKLKRNTLYLSIYYYDKYIRLTDQKDFYRQHLIAQATLLIAMKYQQIYPPLLSHWAKGKEKLIIQQQAKIIKALDFKLAYTTTHHYLQIYLGKNIHTSQEEKKLYQLILDLYLFSGYIYDQHPLKIVQEIFQSFRATAFMEKDTQYEHSDVKVKKIIEQNYKVWEFLLEMDIYKRK